MDVDPMHNLLVPMKNSMSVKIPPENERIRPMKKTNRKEHRLPVPSFFRSKLLVFQGVSQGSFKVLPLHLAPFLKSLVLFKVGG